ncbi:uncharacterized protein LOC111297853 [Durio zibethinus]|uniref:Uncharacterized protein LOC111297853 n=1 Tax=Durio zibethinus TaxID=66656 RepID=A0A6P5Z6J4_DURZI|nr:uncharacterized protein LOC111297853 [Durio zibethinus]
MATEIRTLGPFLMMEMDPALYFFSVLVPQVYPRLKNQGKGTARVSLSRESQQKEDELVRCRSNLLGYLQCVDSGENLQEKALNVGVLDWARNDVSSTSTMSSLKTNTKSSTLSSAVPRDAPANKSKRHSSTCSSLSSSHKDELPRGAKPSTQKVRHTQDIETTYKSASGQLKKSRNYKSFGQTYSDVILEKGKNKDLDQRITSEMGNMSSNMSNHGVSPLLKETARVCDGGAKNRVAQRREIDVNKKDLDQKHTSDGEASLSKSRLYAVSLGSRKMLSAQSDKTKKKETQESELDLTPRCFPGQRKNINLLIPRSARNSFYEEPQELLDGTLNETNRNRFSYDFLQKVRFGELCSEVPHSCPFPPGVEMNPENGMMAQGLEASFDAFHGSACPKKTGNMRSQGDCSAGNNIKSQDADFETLRTLEEEMAELTTRKSRTTSPNRGFSFSLNRMTRSFSFKEGSAVSQVSSTYVSVRSGPVRSDSPVFSDDAKREKVNGHNRTRSSPLRRMLDPLLKSKGLNSFRFTDTVQPPKGSLNSSSAQPVNTNEFLEEGKFESSIIHALLEVRIKNGLPLFRFVVDNGRKMLATTMNSLASSAKGGSDQNYIFSSVCETKKKCGSWISQGNKEKNCGYIHNIIGQMKISNSHISDLTAQGYCNEYRERESVLFGVGQRQADQPSAKFTPNTELAAVVIKMPGESNDVQQGDKDIMKKGFIECLATGGCNCNSMENASFNSTTVIVPLGVHSLPNRGIPSPLIDRWKSGGLCDCGGWDVGCKIRILSNQNSRCCNISRTCQACLNANRLELYAQGEAQQSRPIFSLVPHKNGVYAIEFNSSITALQAFFISVTVISCQKSTDLTVLGNLPEGRDIMETVVNGSLGMENKPNFLLGNVPAKHAANTSRSPVGRV